MNKYARVPRSEIQPGEQFFVCQLLRGSGTVDEAYRRTAIQFPTTLNTRSPFGTRALWSVNKDGYVYYLQPDNFVIPMDDDGNPKEEVPEEPKPVLFDDIPAGSTITYPHNPAIFQKPHGLAKNELGNILILRMNDDGIFGLNPVSPFSTFTEQKDGSYLFLTRREPRTRPSA